MAEVEPVLDPGQPRHLRSGDGAHALILARIPGDADHVRARVLPATLPEVTRGDELRSRYARAAARRSSGPTVPLARQDFVRAELVIFPLVFRCSGSTCAASLAALLPILAGLFAMVIALALLRIPLLYTDVSTFALNLTLAMGLGLGIDYCAVRGLAVPRGGTAGPDRHAAVAGAVEHAGRTVLFSGITVAASLAVLFALPFDFLRSFAYAGIAVVDRRPGRGRCRAARGARRDRRRACCPAACAAEACRRRAGSGTGLAARVMRRPLPSAGVAAAASAARLRHRSSGCASGVADDRILPASRARPGRPRR